MTNSFTDERGTIVDILDGPIDCVTRIFTRAGAVRGNHYHAETWQWTYIVSGSLRVVHVPPGADGWSAPEARDYSSGEMVEDAPGVAHAWRALEDTTVLVFTRGPRSGGDYEKDVTRLPEGERLLW